MTYPHAIDLELIPFEFGATRQEGRFELTVDLARIDGALYGGTGVAASVMAMEAATERDALWVVTQYIAQAKVGERIDWVAHTLALGGRVAQLHVVATVDDRTIFTAVGSTALPRPNGLEGQYVPMPLVAPADDSPPLRHGAMDTELRELGFSRTVEYREARSEDGGPAGPMVLWARFRSRRPMTRAGIAYVADMVGPAVARSAGKIGGGFSLDNSLRFAAVPETEWILLDLRGDVASRGYGHGSFTAWSTDGTLVATGGQTANMNHVFDVGSDGEIETWRRTILEAARSGRQ